MDGGKLEASPGSASLSLEDPLALEPVTCEAINFSSWPILSCKF